MPAQPGRLAERSTAYDCTAPLLASLTRQDSMPSDRTTLRADLVVAFLPVVTHIAARYSGRGEPTEDLRQVGTVGLMGALDRFVPPPDATDLVGAFLAFAVPTVTGEIRRHFRDRTWSMRVPRRLKDLQSSINGAVGPLSQELGRAPRPSEIAARLGIATEEVVEGLDAQQAYRSTSLDELVSGADTALTDTLGVADAELDKVEYRQTLAPLLDELPERERTILVLRFFGNMTQTQIANRVGISQMHVSRLLAQTVAQLRRRMLEDE
jgi:RNA polymerase sigma-B factor